MNLSIYHLMLLRTCGLIAFLTIKHLSKVALKSVLFSPPYSGA